VNRKPSPQVPIAYFTLKDVERLFRIGTTTVYAWRDKGRWDILRIDGLSRIAAFQVRRVMKRLSPEAELEGIDPTGHCPVCERKWPDGPHGALTGGGSVNRKPSPQVPIAYFTLKDVRRLFRIGTTTVYAWRKKGRWDILKIDGLSRIPAFQARRVMKSLSPEAGLKAIDPTGHCPVCGQPFPPEQKSLDTSASLRNSAQQSGKSRARPGDDGRVSDR
jgi:predicted nucleic acid-binding Zn ribbon protein